MNRLDTTPRDVPPFNRAKDCIFSVLFVVGLLIVALAIWAAIIGASVGLVHSIVELFT